MSDLAVARRYAHALNQESVASGAVETTDADMATVRSALADSAELGRFFESPVISREKKKAVVDALFGERVGTVTLRLIHLLVDKGREQQLELVAQAYQAIRDDQMGIADVSVRSARALTDEDQKAIAASLEKRIGKRVRLTVAVDSTLIGGIVVKVGDTVYDGSVSNRLASLRERLLESAILN